MNERDAQVGTNGGLSQRWHEDNSPEPDGRFGAGQLACAKELDAAKLHIEEAVKALPTFYGRCSSDDVLKIIREIL